MRRVQSCICTRVDELGFLQNSNTSARRGRGDSGSSASEKLRINRVLSAKPWLLIWLHWEGNPSQKRAHFLALPPQRAEGSVILYRAGQAQRQGLYL